MLASFAKGLNNVSSPITNMQQLDKYLFLYGDFTLQASDKISHKSSLNIPR